MLTMYIVYILKKSGHKAVEVADSRILEVVERECLLILRDGHDRTTNSGEKVASTMILE